jgi:hypothetical protein
MEIRADVDLLGDGAEEELDRLTPPVHEVPALLRVGPPGGAAGTGDASGRPSPPSTYHCDAIHE